MERPRCEVLDLSAAARIGGEWNDLAARSLEPSVFNDPAFVLPAARHLAGRRGPAFLAVRSSDGTLVGLCPVRRPWRPSWLAARQWTHPQATEAFPLLDAAAAQPALQAILDAVGLMPGRPAAVVWMGLRADGPTAALLRASGASFQVFDPRTRAILPRGAGDALTGKARKQLRRQAHRLSERGEVRFLSAEDPGAVSRALSRFLDLEAKGWKGRRGTALASRPATRTFAQEALRALAGQGRCRIDSLDVAEDAVAMGVVLRAGDRAFFWKTAYDESLGRLSPGVHLSVGITERQGREQVTVTDSCAVAGHSMIDRIWADRVTVADWMVATARPSSPAFRTACLVEAQRRSLRHFAKTIASRLRP